MFDEVITPPLQCGLNTPLDDQHKLTPIDSVVLALAVQCSGVQCGVGQCSGVQYGVGQCSVVKC